jgi:SAM-dependent methyltransferase
MPSAGLDFEDGWWDALGCPLCHGDLRSVRGEQLMCATCGVLFAVQGHILLLLRPQDDATFADFNWRYRQARLGEGCLPVSAEQAFDLPFVSPPGYRRLYWTVRCQSYRRLMRYLARDGPPPAAGPVADLGAGVGWLSFRLAQAGYRVLAVDASLDDAFGLGAAEGYVTASERRLLLAQGNLAYPPLQEDRWSLVIFNASLHYARDLEATLHRAARALSPGGRVIVLDTPIARRPVRGTGRGDRHLGHQELHDALVCAGLCPRWGAIWRGPRWWAYRLKAWLKHSAPFGFPMVVAERR